MVFPKWLYLDETVQLVVEANYQPGFMRKKGIKNKWDDSPLLNTSLKQFNIDFTFQNQLTEGQLNTLELTTYWFGIYVSRNCQIHIQYLGGCITSKVYSKVIVPK